MVLAVGEVVGEVVEEAAEGVLEDGHDVVLVEGPGFFLEVGGGGVGIALGRLAGDVAGGLGEFDVEGLQPPGIIGGGHLAEEVAGAEDAAEEALGVVGAPQVLVNDVDVGPEDEPLHHLDVLGGEVEFPQEAAGEVGAPGDVDGGEFGAGAGLVSGFLEVADVVEEGGGDDQIVVAGVEAEEAALAAQVAVDEPGDGGGDFAGVAEMVETDVAGLVLGIAAGEKLLGTLEERMQPGYAMLGKMRRVDGLDALERFGWRGSKGFDAIKLGKLG